MPLIEWAQAKINLSLRILGRRADGYHQLETLMQTLRFADRLILEERPSGIELCCDDVRLSLGPDNLVHQAASLLTAAFPGHGVRISLQKRIPWQAGLGGGSSDAAATLRGLNRLWRLGLSLTQLIGLAAQLGSDVPFFVVGGLAVARGRGEQIIPLNVHLDFAVALLVPPFGLATADVYRAWRPVDQPTVIWSTLQQALADRDQRQILNSLHNDLEQPAFALRPELATVKHNLVLGGFPVLLSGSGSCLFVLLLTDADARRLHDLVPAGYQLITTRFSPLLTEMSAGEDWPDTEI